MKKALFIILAIAATTALAFGINAEPKQILVFRNTGQVNLFWSDKMDSISFSRIDAGGIEHPEVVAQVFHTPDTTIAIPICEIDSVAFGNRNEMVVKPNVKILTDNDMLWITHYDGQAVYYKASTPSDILPKVGDGLFYGVMDDIFPLGLVARATSVESVRQEYAVTVTDVELSDLFERLFYAGAINQTPSNAAIRRSAPIDLSQKIETNISFGNYGYLNGADEVSIVGDVVAMPLTGYYNLNATFSNKFNAELGLKVEGSDHADVQLIKIPLGVYAMVFTPVVKFNGFFDYGGEAKAELSYEHLFGYKIWYEKFQDKDATYNVMPLNADETTNEAKLDVILDGNIGYGIEAILDFNILRETAGARLKLQVGPALEGHFGLHSLIRCSERFNPEAYNEATLGSSIKLKASGTVYIKNLFSKDENEHEIYSRDFEMLKSSIDLFPKFTQSKAVRVASTKADKVTTSTKVNNRILREVEVGFELVDATNNVVDSTFVDMVKVAADSIQGFATEFDVKQYQTTAIKDLRTRPVFHYNNVMVCADFANILTDPHLQPMVFEMSNGAASCLSGVPFSGSASSAATHYQAGPAILHLATDTIFNPTSPPAIGNYINSNTAEDLCGYWVCEDDGNFIGLLLREDGSGTLESSDSERALKYEINVPQSGDICLTLTDLNEIIVLTIVEYSNNLMKCRTIGRPSELIFVRS